MGGSDTNSLQAMLADYAGGKIPVLAGGTDFYPALGDRPAPHPVLDITRIDGLKALGKQGADWRIGAAVTWTELVNAELPSAFDGLKEAAREIGSVQIQNLATVVGNLCNASPAADGVPPLLALQARVELTAPMGVRVLPLEAFILGVRRTALLPGEIVTGLLVPEHPSETFSRFKKLGSRSYLVISIAMTAITLVIDGEGLISDARVAVGACSPVAIRLSALEAALMGSNADNPNLAAVVSVDHLSPLSPIDDIRGSRHYRMKAVLEMLRRSLADCAGERTKS